MLDKSVWHDDLCHERRTVVGIEVTTESFHGHESSTIWYIYDDQTRERLMHGIGDRDVAEYYAKNLRECLKEAQDGK